MTRLFHRCTALAIATGLLLVARTSSAEDVCPRTPSWGQVPNFWVPDPTTSSPKKQLQVRYDGRWANAAQVPLDNGSSGARARILDGTDNAIYIAIEIDSTANDREVFWFGYAPATLTDSNGATLMEISVRPDGSQPNPQFQVWEQQTVKCDALTCPAGASGCSAPCPALPTGGKASYRLLHGVAPVGGLSRFVWDAEGFNSTVAAATWINPASGPGPRAWHSPLYGTGGPPTGATVMLRIPKTIFSPPATGLADHKIWLSAASCNFLGSGPVNCASQGNWPAAGEVLEVSAGSYSAPALSDWAVLHLTGTACPAVSTLAEAGVQNGATYSSTTPFTWPQRMYLDNDGVPTNDPPNWFAARTAMTVTTVANRYKARFFLADWGSQIGNLDISQWTEIGQANNPGGVAGTPATPATEHLSMRWPPAGISVADAKILACKYSNCDATVVGCPYPTGVLPDPCMGIAGARTHHPHQCTQVRLETAAPAGTSSYQFANDAMIFNTDFVAASVFWRVATISTEGIAKDKPAPGPAPAGGREILLYVRSSNLPETSDEMPATKTVERLELLAESAGKPPPGKLPPPQAAFARTLREAHGPSGNNQEPKPEQQDKVHALVRNMGVDTARIVAPTLEVLAYYDTARVMDTHPGKTYRWLQPMTSFRYVVEHKGKIKGWAWAIDGAEPLGGNWFRMRVADNSKQRIRTRIQAVDGARMPPGNPVWPPGKGWINEGGVKPGSIKVTVKKKGGCSVTGDDSSGATIVLLLACVWIYRRRRA